MTVRELGGRDARRVPVLVVRAWAACVAVLAAMATLVVGAAVTAEGGSRSCFRPVGCLFVEFPRSESVSAAGLCAGRCMSGCKRWPAPAIVLLVWVGPSVCLWMSVWIQRRPRGCEAWCWIG